MRYHVTWTDGDGDTRYGVIESYSTEAKQAEADGNVIVEDAITGDRYLLHGPSVHDVPSRENDQHDDFDDYVEAEFEAAQKRSDELGQFGKGAMVSVPVGDGAAYYVVVGGGSKNTKIEWRGFGPDRWVDGFLGYGGTFPRDRIENLWSGGRALASIFSRSTVEKN